MVRRESETLLSFLERQREKLENEKAKALERLAMLDGKIKNVESDLADKRHTPDDEQGK
jgi:hypothetical protein